MGMTGRLLTVRGQMCEFDDYFVLQTGQRIEITLHEPVLRERDVYLLMDALPTTRTSFSEGVVARYIFEQLQTTSDGLSVPVGVEAEVSFVFIQSEEDLLLSTIKSSEVPSEILESAHSLAANSTAIAQQACDVSINPFKWSAEMELDHETLDLLPARQTVISWLGLPLESANDGEHLVYEFRLKGDQDDHPIARIEADYDQSGDRLNAVEASFTRYNASIDVPEGTVRLKLGR